MKAEQADLRALDELGKRANCNIELIHHVSKGGLKLDWSDQGAGTFGMEMATEGQSHISRFTDLDNNARNAWCAFAFDMAVTLKCCCVSGWRRWT